MSGGSGSGRGSEAPSWVVEYIGIPYDPQGREKGEGLDCWGLVRTVYWERYGIELPSFEGIYYVDREIESQVSELEKYVTAEKEAMKRNGTFHEVPLGEAIEGDILIFRVIGRPLHMALYLNEALMLTTRKGVDSCLESLHAHSWKNRLDAVYRHESRHRS